ncbi:rhodanese-like domain-containing protein [Alphaproteobacteria bacterium]|nr:rhodanese-like domain-containing protein [Alphaproteobacteria bacterium]
MKIRFYIKLIIFLLTVKFAFADVVDINNEQIVELSKTNIPIVDVRSSSEWDQTGVIPTSILLTFFDKEGNYDLDKWYEKLLLEIEEGEPIILICRSGNRSRIIAEMMDKQFDNIIYNAKRGITSWIDEKLIIVKPQIN